MIITKKKLKEITDEERENLRHEFHQKVAALFKEDKPYSSLVQKIYILDYNEAILDVLEIIRKMRG